MNRLLPQISLAKTPSFLNPGASAQTIADFEKESGLPLPEDYRRWLSFCDGGELFAPDYIFYGITTQWNLTLANSRENRDSYNLPPRLYIIGNLSFGDLFCLDVLTGAIVEWDYEACRIAVRWDSFRELLEDMILDERGG